MARNEFEQLFDLVEGQQVRAFPIRAHDKVSGFVGVDSSGRAGRRLT
jgi:hypothetical protein